jgi:hypothetical protein
MALSARRDFFVKMMKELDLVKGRGAMDELLRRANR